jgi:hypothetical protein
MKRKSETRTAIMKRIDKIIADQSKGQLVCRTCNEAGCCYLEHDNMRPYVKGDRFEKNGTEYTL